MQLSVVIPFYQVEKYIGACLDALAALPAEESEILLVDDCGRDGSAAIAAAYCAAHPSNNWKAKQIPILQAFVCDNILS